MVNNKKGRTNLLDWFEVGIGKVLQEPKKTRTEDITSENEDGRNMEQVEQTRSPMYESEYQRSVVEIAYSLCHRGVKHTLERKTCT